MSRLVVAVVACLLLSSCSTTGSADTLGLADLAALAKQIDSRMKERHTTTFRTEVRSFTGADESGTSADTTITGSWRYTTDVSMTMHVVNQPRGEGRDDFDIVVVPGVVYSRKLPDNRGWRRTDGGTVADHIGRPAEAAPELSYLKAAISGTSVREDLDGVPVTRTDLSADPSLMAERWRADHAALVNQQSAIAVSVWVDDTGLPRKVTALLTGKRTERSTTWLSDWGRGVTIIAPEHSALEQG